MLLGLGCLLLKNNKHGGGSVDEVAGKLDFIAERKMMHPEWKIVVKLRQIKSNYYLISKFHCWVYSKKSLKKETEKYILQPCL